MKKLMISMAIAACLLTACKSNSGTTSSADSAASALKKNKQTALDVEMSISKHDVDGLLKNCSADFVDYGNGEAKPMKNADSIKADFKGLYAAFPDFKADSLTAIADSNTVVVTGVWSATFKNDFMKMKANGKSFKIPEADIFTFNKEGKINSHKAVQSSISILYQLGFLVPKK
jgi:predicted ester cyclase